MAQAVSSLKVTPADSTVGNPSATDAEPSFLGIKLKWLSLMALTVQTSGQVLLIRWAGAQRLPKRYLSSTAVFFTEVVKVFASLLLLRLESHSFADMRRQMSEHFLDNKAEVLKAAVPSLVYTVQNNLMFYSLLKLSAPVQQVLYQMKILTTAGIGVCMLGKPLTRTKWASLYMLCIGVALIQWPKNIDFDAQPKLAWDSTALLPFFLALTSGDQAKGFLAVLLACVTSGFAGVYIQRMLQQTTASIWIRNVQFGMFGSIMGLLVAVAQDGEMIKRDGLLQGYSERVVAVIAMNAFGGLLCAMMLKYAGATLGCFSTALSIILTCILSATFLQDFVPDDMFLFGTTLSVAATLMFGLGIPDIITTSRQVHMTSDTLAQVGKSNV